ncbi:MAG: radical SAM protein [Sedimentisphaerales bacterium]|jgi:MoaA/NifB/PqqE/SkfB family radical SAM enzyme|nr:radical SAM protein [Sedimentisphaerales bacterium]
MRSEVISSTLIKMVNHKQLRKLLAKKIDDYIYKNMVSDDSGDLRQVQIRRYQYLSAMLRCVNTSMDKGYVSPEIIKKIVNVFVQNNLVREDQSYNQAVEKFKDKYGEYPPTFIVLSPTQRCNLKCIGCYASSAADTSATIPYSYVDRIVGEVHDDWGVRFITISGGEPFLYRSEGKTLLDLYRKYDDMFFHTYTNGTVISEEIAQQMAKTANVTPAISVEGFEQETDQRRGRGTFKKILEALERLRQVGVPFGISVMATSRNVDLLLTDEFYDYYFQEQGACFMWQFQLMPIGRGKDEVELMVVPEKRVELYRKWEKLLTEKKYCLADFWNSGVLARGCIAYGRSGGYAYIDWHGNVTPCAFIPYYVDNIYDLYGNGKTLTDALFSDLMKNGRKWQREYGLDNCKKPSNWLMPCSIRDHYEIFRKSVLPENVKSENEKAKEALESPEYFGMLKSYDNELQGLTEKIWETEYLDNKQVCGESKYQNSGIKV